MEATSRSEAPGHRIASRAKCVKSCMFLVDTDIDWSIEGTKKDWKCQVCCCCCIPGRQRRVEGHYGGGSGGGRGAGTAAVVAREEKQRRERRKSTVVTGFTHKSLIDKLVGLASHVKRWFTVCRLWRPCQIQKRTLFTISLFSASSSSSSFSSFFLFWMRFSHSCSFAFRSSRFCIFLVSVASLLPICCCPFSS